MTPRGFTLIEIIVSLAILAILTGGVWVWTQSERRINLQPTPMSPLAKTELSPTPGPTADWKIYTDPVYSFSLKYPPTWVVTKGNQHLPSVPSTMTEVVNFQSGAGVFDVSIIPWHNNLKKDLREEVSSFISGFLGDFEVSYENTQVGNYTALRGSYLQSAMGAQTKTVITGLEKGDFVLFFITQFEVDHTSRLDLYNQILSTFKFLD